MNQKKIAIIIAHRKAQPSQLWMESISSLDVPEGFQVEIIDIHDAESMSRACSSGMHRSDAKYKIYLMEGCVILHEKILSAILSIFMSDPQIGLLGTSGTEVIPTDAICPASRKRAGQIYFLDGDRLASWRNPEESCLDVMAVDPYFMATQYDIPWRTDLFHKDSFWELSQCMEFRRQGYRIVVPRQESAWIAVPNDHFEYSRTAQDVFLDEYSKDIFPLVSIVIPTYNRPEYFREALESVLAQTYRNLDIFVTDNSHNTLTKDLMQPYLDRDKRITYVHHPEYDATGNWSEAQSYNNPAAPYVNWLMDDDLFHPRKIEKMMNFYLELEGLSLVTSYRRVIDENGDFLPDRGITVPICEEDTIFKGKDIGNYILENTVNIIGEPTTALIRKEFLNNNDLGWSGKEGKYLISDFPTWLRLMSQGDLVYIREPLSYFRWHEGNEQNTAPMMQKGIICWAMEIRYAWEHRIFLDNPASRDRACISWLKLASPILSEFVEQDFRSPDTEVVKQNAIHIIQMLQTASEDGAMGEET